ncbi:MULTISPECIES: replication initiation protein [Lysinibacillus]|uniref:replication initiation protein n=1 Tax=Lysinibacillus TaxID=400634 RepID=UPI0000F36321|nr:MULTISPECIES: replication initiation protein [Lysinibacillus]EAZ83475.1 initiator replication protein RepB [Bacillus sp. B14905]MED4077566.1 replication initiation protein [Lysinibacillus fusiformis]QTB29502.1 replication initiation protein [Lysinibacillus sphaericus]
MVVRKNEKQSLMNYENSISKSNELSMAKLNNGLTLNQMQLLAFAIYSTQKNGATEFHKADFERKFEMEKYQTIHAKQDAQKLLDIKFSIEDLENDYFEYWNVFQSIKYKEGCFRFKWTEDMVPHILELKEKYITTDLTITSKFKSGFSWALYDYLKAHYGYWHKPISKDALMRLFGVENKKTYQNNTGRFKSTVLDVAIKEINSLTELEIRYNEEKKGRSIIGFDLIWSNGTTMISATKKQIKELSALIQTVFDDVFKYVNLNDEENREKAINIIKELEEYREFTMDPICITKERADFLIQQAKFHLSELERLFELNQKTTVPFYNWLEDRA